MRMFLIVLFGLEMIILPVTESHQVFGGTNLPTQFISIDVLQETINEDPGILNDLDNIIIVGISSTAQLQEMELSPSVPSPSKCPTPVLQTKKSP